MHRTGRKRLTTAMNISPRLALLLAATPFVLGACGAEVAGTAATVGKLQADQASQAQGQAARATAGYLQAQQAGVDRAASAAE